MARELHRMQINMRYASNLPRDVSVNSWWLTQVDPDSVIDQSGCFEAFEHFYGSPPNSIGGYLSSTFNNVFSNMSLYDNGDPLESPPVATSPLTVSSSPSGVPLPNEVACCLTMHAVPQPGTIKRQSWRGRVFLGPFDAAATVDGASGDSRPSLAFRTSVVNAAKVLHTALLAANASLVIASKVTQTLFPVQNFYVDNAWDTIRARGDRPTSNFPSGPLAGPSAPIAHPIR